jgi:CRP/FNR family cyclic AMP-dependent transcriptional regulator
MPTLVPDVAAFERRLAGLPVVKHPATEVVLTAGSKTGRLLFLKSGAVEVIKDGVKIANVSAPGSVFGDQAVLLDQPHSADVRTLEQSEFFMADARAILAGDPTVVLYVAAIQLLIEVKRQLKAGEAPSVISRTVEKVEEVLNYSGEASLVFGTPGYSGA